MEGLRKTFFIDITAFDPILDRESRPAIHRAGVRYY